MTAKTSFEAFLSVLGDAPEVHDEELRGLAEYFYRAGYQGGVMAARDAVRLHAHKCEEAMTGDSPNVAMREFVEHVTRLIRCAGELAIQATVDNEAWLEERQQERSTKH